MRTTHRLLLRIWYDPACDFSSVRIGYLNRGAPGNCSVIEGKEVSRLENRYIILDRPGDHEEDETWIPYHRIWWIQYHGKMVWSRTSGETD